MWTPQKHDYMCIFNPEYLTQKKAFNLLNEIVLAVFADCLTVVYGIILF